MSTNPDIERARQIDLHSNDVRDIKILRELPAFRQYWTRRLLEKYNQADQEFHDTAPASEALRQVVATYADLLRMMDTDEKQSNLALEQLVGKRQE